MDLVLGKNKATVFALKGGLRHLLPVVIVGVCLCDENHAFLPAVIMEEIPELIHRQVTLSGIKIAEAISQLPRVSNEENVIAFVKPADRADRIVL